MNFLRFSRNFSVSMIFLVFFCISGWCSTNCSIEYPQEGQEFYDTIPETYSIICDNSNEKKNIMLNGVVVREYFQANNNKFTSDGQKLSAFLKQGTNFFSVEPDTGPTVTFHVDNEGPQVKITKVEGENPLFISGELKDPAGINSLSVNGVYAVIDRDDSFTVSVSKADKFRFVAYDTDERKSVTTYSDRDTIVNDIVRLRVHETAIHDMLPVLQGLIEDLDFNAALRHLRMDTFFKSAPIELPKVVIIPRRCHTFWYWWWGWKSWTWCSNEVAMGPLHIPDFLNLKIDIANFDIDEVIITQMDLASGHSQSFGRWERWEGLSVHAIIKNVTVGFNIDSDVLGLSHHVRKILEFLRLDRHLDALDGRFTAKYTIDRLRIKGDIGLTANNGKIDSKIVDIKALDIKAFDFVNFNSDSRLKINLPHEFNLFGLGLAQKVTDSITHGINDAKSDINRVFLGKIGPMLVNPVIDTLVKKIQLHTAIGLTNGAQLSTLFAIQEINIENNSVMKVALNGRLGTEQSSLSFLDTQIAYDIGTPDIEWVDDGFFPGRYSIPASLGPCPNFSPKALGYLHTDKPVPDPQMKGNEVALTVSGNLINQSLLAMYEGGLFNMVFASNSDTILHAESNGDSNFHIDSRLITVPNKFTIDILEELPPFKVINTPTSTPEIIFKGGEIVIPHLIINNFEVLVQVLEDDKWNDMIKAIISAIIPIAIEMVDSNLSVQLISPDIKLDIVTNKLHEDIPLSFDSDEFSNKYFINKLIEQVNTGLSEVKLPLMDMKELDMKFGSETITVVPRELFAVDPHIGLTVNFD